MAVHVFDTMGTTVSLRFAGAIAAPAVLTQVEDVFRAFDLRFSLYRPASELSHVAAGELLLTRASTELREAYAEALEWSRHTDGVFTPHRPDGVIDLSGTVKAKAMDAAATVLEAAGESAWMLAVGGDILTRGTVGGEPWQAGVVDPDDRGGLLCVIELSGRRTALASSGTAERGEHIWRASAGSVPDAFRQVTVRADDIVTADVVATALVAAGPERYQDLLDRFDVDAITVDNSGVVTATPGLRRVPGLAPA